MNTILFLLAFSILKLNPAIAMAETTFEVVTFYEISTTETGMKVLTTTGELAGVEVLLKPAKPDEGSYEILVTRKAPDLYLVTDCNRTGKIVANKFYIETRNCHEFASYDKATLVVKGNFGVVKGNLTFK